MMDESWEPEVHQGAHGGVEPDDVVATFRVVTWNIQFGVEVEAAAHALLRTDELRSADIVLLQEMDEVGTETIARTVGLNHVFASSGVHPRTGRHFGNAVLSRWPLRDPEVVIAVAQVGGAGPEPDRGPRDGVDRFDRRRCLQCAHRGAIVEPSETPPPIRGDRRGDRTLGARSVDRRW